jgi:hypothetical protein
MTLCSDIKNSEDCKKNYPDCVWDTEDNVCQVIHEVESDPRIYTTVEFENIGKVKNRAFYINLWNDFLNRKLTRKEFSEKYERLYKNLDNALFDIVTKYIKSSEKFRFLNKIDDVSDYDLLIQDFYQKLKDKSNTEGESIITLLQKNLQLLKKIKNGDNSNLKMFDEETKNLIIINPTIFFKKLDELYKQKLMQFRLFSIFQESIKDVKQLEEIQYKIRAYVYKALDKNRELMKIKEKLSPEFWVLLTTQPLSVVKKNLYPRKDISVLKNPYVSKLNRRRLRVINPNLNEIFVKNIDECILIHKLKPWLPDLQRMNTVYFISHPAGLLKEQIPEEDTKFYGSLITENMYEPTNKFWALHCMENHKKTCNYENLILTFTGANKKFIHGTYNTKTKQKYIFCEKDFEKECEYMSKKKDADILQSYLMSDINKVHRDFIRNMFFQHNIVDIEEKIYEKNKNKKLSDYLLDAAKVIIFFRKDYHFYNISEETRKMLLEGFYDDMMMFVPLIYLLPMEDKTIMLNLFENACMNIKNELAVSVYNKENFKNLRIKDRSFFEFVSFYNIFDENKVPMYRQKLSQLCNYKKDNFYVLQNGQIQCINASNYKSYNIDLINKHFNAKYKDLYDIIYQNIYELIKQNKEAYKTELEIFGDSDEIEIQISKVEKALDINLTEEEKTNILFNLNLFFKQDLNSINNDIIKLIKLDINKYKKKYLYGKDKNVSGLNTYEDIITSINEKYPSTKNYIMLNAMVDFIDSYLQSYTKPTEESLEDDRVCHVCQQKHKEAFKTVQDFTTVYICSDKCLSKLDDTQKEKKNFKIILIKSLMDKLTQSEDIKRDAMTMFRRQDFSEKDLLDYLRHSKLILPRKNKETEYALYNLCDMFKISYTRTQNYIEFVRTFQDLLSNADFWMLYEPTLKQPPEGLLNINYILQFCIINIFNNSKNDQILAQAKKYIQNHSKYSDEQLIDFLITSKYWIPDIKNPVILSSILIIYIQTNIPIPVNFLQLWSKLFNSNIFTSIINSIAKFPNKPDFFIPKTDLPSVNLSLYNPLDPKNKQSFDSISNNFYIVNDNVISGENIKKYIQEYSKELYDKVIAQKNFSLSKDLVQKFYRNKKFVEVSNEELKKYRKDKKMVSGLITYLKAIVDPSKKVLPNVTLPPNFDEIAMRRMMITNNYNWENITKEVKRIFSLNVSTSLINMAVFYSQMWNLVKFHMYVVNEQNIENINKEAYLSQFYKRRESESIFDEEEEEEKVELSVDEITKRFDAFMEKFNKERVDFINIAAYRQTSEESEIFEEEPQGEEVVYVAEEEQVDGEQGNDEVGEEEII